MMPGVSLGILAGMAANRVTTSFRLSDEERQIIARWAKRLGLNGTSVVGLALRQLDEHGIRALPERPMEISDDPDDPKLYNPDA